MESEKALVAESHNMRNQQMDPFTRRQCKPTIVSNSRDPAVQAAILAQLNAKYGSGVLPDAPKEMSKASIVPEALVLDCRQGPCLIGPRFVQAGMREGS